MNEEVFRNTRIALITGGGPTDGNYELACVGYNKEGYPIDPHPTYVLGTSLKEVRETLESLLSDINNWEEEELIIQLV
jgi:hypothetical protein